jgi:Bacterial Ig domain
MMTCIDWCANILVSTRLSVRRTEGRRKLNKYVLPLMVCIIFAAVASANAEVIISSPANGATVSGTVIVKAKITDAYWSKLWVDGIGIATAPVGLVSFSWNSASVADGSHKLKVNAYPSSGPANASETITVDVNNHGTGSSTHFGTLPKGASLPGDAACAAEIPWEREMVSANAGPNSTKPSQAQLDAFEANGYAANVYNGTWAYRRVDGQYTGTTDMIFRWAACKWGIDEDLIRAQATNEDWAWNQAQSGGDKRTLYSQCVNGGFKSLWDYQCSSCCYQSWSIFQTKVVYNWPTWPMIHSSTAFAADFHYASMRSCMDGDLAGYFAGRPEYNGHTYAGDIASGNLSTIMWGCVGYHYSGNWYNGNSTYGAIWYIDHVKSAMAAKSWKTRWPTVNWPD